MMCAACCGEVMQTGSSTPVGAIFMEEMGMRNWVAMAGLHGCGRQ